MILLRRKSCSVLASTILESPLHRTKATCMLLSQAAAGGEACKEDFFIPLIL